MRKYFSMFLLATLISAMSLDAQDIITMRDGSTIEAKVSSITPEKVTYHKWNNLKGPEYTTGADRIASIKFQNGDVETFNAPQSNQTKTQPVPAPGANTIAQQVEQASKQTQQEGKLTTPNPYYSRNWMFGARFIFGAGIFSSDDGSISGTSTIGVDGSVRFVPDINNALYAQLNLGFHRFNMTLSPTWTKELGAHSDYFKFEPMVGVTLRNGIYFRTGLTFDFFVGSGNGEGYEMNNDILNDVVFGWPVEIGWATKYTEIGIIGNISSNLFKGENGTNPYIIGLQIAVNI